MRSGTITVKIVRSGNPLAKGYYRLNGGFNNNPTVLNSVHRSGDVIERDILDNIDLINRVYNHDNLRVLVSTEGQAKSPIIDADTIANIEQYYDVSIR